MAVNSFNAQNPPVTTKGDLFTFSTIPTRLGVGANNTVLTADSAEATGLKWAAAATPTQSFTLLNAGGTALTGSSTITVSGISNRNQILVYVDGASAGGSSSMNLRINGDTANNYRWSLIRIFPGSTYESNSTQGVNSTAGSSLQIGQQNSTTEGLIQGAAMIMGANSTSPKVVNISGMGAGFGPNLVGYIGYGLYVGTSAVTSVSLVSTVGNFDAGTMFVYGA